jgi:hypothetical protein
MLLRMVAKLLAKYDLGPGRADKLVECGQRQGLRALSVAKVWAAMGAYR